MSLAASGATQQGRRSTNEDAWLVDLDLGLLVVADGMGGHNAGEVASALAVSSIHAFVKERRTSPSPSLLVDAVRKANGEVLDAASLDPAHAGMGTTVVAVLIADDRAVYAGVGDSRIYLWRAGNLTQLTKDDSWLASTAGEGEGADAPDSVTHPMRHVLTKVVGLRDDMQPVASECRLETDDCLLLCSDGVHGSVPRELLTDLLGQRAPVADLARELVALAIARGASDNSTAVIARRE